jgi:hypothetical protein
MIRNYLDKKQGRTEKIIIIILLILLIPLSILSIITADELINELVGEEEIIEDVVEEVEEEIIEDVVEQIEEPVELIEEINESEVIEFIEETNETSDEEESTLITPDPESRPDEIEIWPGSEPEINIIISHVNKTIRGNNIEIKAIITNSGAKIKNVLGIWDLPSYFEIIRGSKTGNCGDLDSGENCELIINVQTLSTSSLGDSEIKIKVSYQE